MKTILILLAVVSTTAPAFAQDMTEVRVNGQAYRVPRTGSQQGQSQVKPQQQQESPAMRAWRMFPWSNQRTQRGQAELALELQARREALAREQQQNANYRAELRAQAAPKPTVTPSAGAPHFPQQTPIPIKDGHFHPVVRINGVQLTMLADTGASDVALTAKDAQKIGINLQTLQFNGKSNTANGTVPSASLLLPEVNIGGIVLRNVEASCCVIASESLLGMSVLGQLNIRTANGLMYLEPK